MNVTANTSEPFLIEFEKLSNEVSRCFQLKQRIDFSLGKSDCTGKSVEFHGKFRRVCCHRKKRVSGSLSPMRGFSLGVVRGKIGSFDGDESVRLILFFYREFEFHSLA
jgi:hypothetical protein